MVNFYEFSNFGKYFIEVMFFLLFIESSVDGDDITVAFGFAESAGAKYEFFARFDFRDVSVLEVFSSSDLNDFAIFLEKVCAKLAKRRKFFVTIDNKANVGFGVIRGNSKIVIHNFSP